MKIQIDGDEDWDAYVAVCGKMAGRAIKPDEIDPLYECWCTDLTCAQATREVLGVDVLAHKLFFIDEHGVMEVDEGGLRHISTPMRTVERQIREAIDDAHIMTIMAQQGADVVTYPAAWRGAAKEKPMDAINRRFADSIGGQSRGLGLQAYEVAWAGAKPSIGERVGRFIGVCFAAAFMIGCGVALVMAIGWARGG